MRPLLLVCLTFFGCDCGGPGLRGTEDPYHDAFEPPAPMAPGGGAGGGGLVEGSGGGVVEAIDAGHGAFIAGTIWHYAGALPATALHPNVGIEGAVVHLRIGTDPTDVGTVTTDANGKFSIEVSPGVAYAVHADVPPLWYGEPDSLRMLLPLAAGETRQFDDYFFLAGISWVVRDSVTGVAIPGVDVRIVDGAQVLGGPVLTDADGYAHLDSVSQQAHLVLSRQGYRTADFTMPSVDTRHTVLGGCILEPVQ